MFSLAVFVLVLGVPTSDAWVLLTRGDRETVICWNDTSCEELESPDGTVGGWDCLDVTDQPGPFSGCTQTIEFEAAPRFGVDVAVGTTGFEGGEDDVETVKVTPRFTVWQGDRTRADILIPIIWLPNPYPDPWASPCFPDVPPCPFGDVFAGLRGDELEVGPSVSVSTGLELSTQLSPRIEGSIFGGVGFLFEAGNRTEVEGRGVFETRDSTSPVVQLGLALGWQLNDRLRLRLEALGSTAFMESMVVEGPGGQRAIFEGETMTALTTSIGLSTRF